MEGREGRTRTNDDGPPYEGTLERSYAEREKERRRGLCLSEKHELKTMGTDRQCQSGLLAGMDMRRGVCLRGRAASFVCREWSASPFREAARVAGHSEGRHEDVRVRPRTPARQRQVSAPAIRCINNALMYEADEGERQRGNGREGRKTRRVLEGEGDNDLPDSRMKRKEGGSDCKACQKCPHARKKKRTQGVAWMAWLRQNGFLLLDCRGNARIAPQKKALSLLSSFLPPSACLKVREP